MLKHTKIIFALLLSLISIPAVALESVTVLADKSMDMTVIEMAKQYSVSKGVVVNTSFLTAAEQERQIAEGGAADVLITPDLEWIGQLKLQGLLDVYSQVTLASNQLVLIAPYDNYIDVDLTQGMPAAKIIRAIGFEQNFMIGNPQYMSDGIYAKEALRAMNVAEQLEEYTLYIKRPDQIEPMVKGRGAYGVFLLSTVRNLSGVRVLSVLPQHTYQPVQYYAVVIAGDNMDEARKFMEYLKSKAARRLLINNGYVVN